MDLRALIEIADDYARLGSAIQSQIPRVMDGTMNDYNVNPNALDLIREFFYRAKGRIDRDLLLYDELEGGIEEIDAYLESYDSESDH